METLATQLPISEPPGRWAPPNGTELLRQRRLVGAVRRLTCVGAKSRLTQGLSPRSLRHSGSALLSIARGFRSTPFRWMLRSAVAFLCFCATAAFASAKHRSREFNGISATFALLNPSLRLSQPLKIALTLDNGSNHPVEFGYLPFSAAQQIDVFTARGKLVYHKLGSPIFEVGVINVPLKPGATVRTVEEIPLSVFYDLDPGDYYLTFRYDLRVLPDAAMKFYQNKLHSADWVVWDTKKYWFHIHR
jgi:hypothetical protein